MPNVWALQSSIRIEDQPLHTLTCAMEEKCLSSSAYTASQNYGYDSNFGYGGNHKYFLDIFLFYIFG